MDNHDRHVASIVPHVDFTRRGFVVTSLAAGFALAVQPVSAETITTDTNGLVAGDVKIPVSDGEIPAYRAMPDSGGAFPTVLVVHEVFGVHEHIRIFAGAWPSSATSPWRRRCSPAKAMWPR